jgi:DNA-directed RNA polymerase specialized sigma24 family protein
MSVRESFFIESRFPTTEWNLLGEAGGVDSGIDQATLGRVLTRYLPVLREHLIRRFLVNEDEAADLLQSFVLKKVIKNELFAKADRRKGKFRTFLLSSLNNFFIQEQRRVHAAKRPPAEYGITWDEVAEHQLADQSNTPDEVFDSAWARKVLSLALERMKSQCDAAGQPVLWGVFYGRLLRPLLEEVAPLSHEQLAATFQLPSPAYAANLLVAARRMFGRVLRSVVAEYTAEGEDIEAEIHYLKSALFHG